MPSPIAYGFLSGLIIPPIITSLYIRPKLINSKFQEIDLLKHDIDYIGWNVRNLEEYKGLKDEDLYSPVTYYQGR